MRRRALLATLPAAVSLGGASPAPIQDRPMAQRAINRTDGNYSQALEVIGFRRLVFVSGQVGEDDQGQVPPEFKAQARLAWANVAAQLVAAAMTLNDIVKMTLFLSDRKYRGQAYETRREALGDHAPAMTIIICGIYREEWLLEIEVIAAA
ncbi:MAG: RidA family protein [Caulobacter sp.]|nr:RidA family protein [Caulobacter sp.]